MQPTDQEELKMPSAEEMLVMESRMAVLHLELPKGIWWVLDCVEKNSGNQTSEMLAVLLKQALFSELSKLRGFANDLMC